MLDGLVGLPDGSYLVTSWEGRCVHRVYADGRWRVALGNAVRFEPYAL